LVEAAPPTPYRTRHDGWTEPRKRAFLHALARTGCVRDACRQARISSTSAYRHRRRDAGFAAAWERALTEALPVLEAAAFERAVEGVWEPVVSGGKVAVYKKRYSDAILVTLLRRADAAAERRTARPPLSVEELRERLDRKIAMVKARMEAGDGADGG
jgi:ribose 1,5-bisphosphokinase PhnN